MTLTSSHQMGDLVAEFHAAFDHYPTPAQQSVIVLEEIKELHDAAENLVTEQTIEAMEDFIKELVDFSYTIAGLDQAVERYGVSRQEDLVGSMIAAHASIPAIELMNDAFDAGFLTDAIMLEAYERVHESNMTKRDDNGDPIKNDAGKILKGPNYVAPDLSDLAEKAMTVFKEGVEAAGLGDPEEATA